MITKELLEEIIENLSHLLEIKREHIYLYEQLNEMIMYQDDESEVLFGIKPMNTALGFRVINLTEKLAYDTPLSRVITDCKLMNLELLALKIDKKLLIAPYRSDMFPLLLSSTSSEVELFTKIILPKYVA